MSSFGIPVWLQFPVVVALALASWISGLDETGNPGEAYLLWAATAIAGGLLMMRLVVRAR